MSEEHDEGCNKVGVTIPKDILEMADVALSYEPVRESTPGFQIAMALYAERRRCAAIAKAFLMDREDSLGIHGDADKIFRAIMSDQCAIELANI